MTTRQFVVLMLICTILCWGGWALVLLFINPETTGALGFALFYLSFSFALIGTLALIGYGFRWLFTRRYSKSEEVTISFRQAVFLAIVVSGALFLQGQRFLTWLNAVILVILVTMVEFIFISFKQASSLTNNSRINHEEGTNNSRIAHE